MLLNGLTVLFVIVGLVFFTLGTVGLLRFADVHSRLHALTKADNLGLGFVVLGLMFQVESVPVGVKLAMIWLLVLLASTSACYLVAEQGLRGLSGLRSRGER
ncbi:cation:proton antiporter [Phycisphaerales bacterium AB-hyl4]|uniref:Cation:proton antiporter n=1 Tax=Natronomicrosphaera hydrolytica TaxID=3242702 RepID=A0ABV4U8R7_9BACT